MKNPLRTVITLLDRKPNTEKGQSLVELTLTMPIFLVMLLGLVEIGWLANNYLTLIDVTREAGRVGSTRDPLSWNNGNTKNYQVLDCDTSDATFNKYGADDNPPITTWPGNTGALSGKGYSDSGLDPGFGYYDIVACNLLTSMLPLEFNDETDDVVVSVITYSIFDLDPGPGANLQAKVTGRFPSNSNECAGERDPFDPGSGIEVADAGLFYEPGNDGQRGFIFRGNLSEDGCLGSRFDITEIETLLNRTTIFDDTSPIRSEEIDLVPNNAMVLVEISWQHEQLLGLPFFQFVDDEIQLNVWSFFPVSAAEPTATPEPEGP